MPGNLASTVPAGLTTGLPGQILREAHPPELLNDWLDDSQQRTLALVEDLTDEQLVVPQRIELNPILWDVGHIAWFAERWALRRSGEESILGEADSLYDPTQVPHAQRWAIQLPGRSDTLNYLHSIHDRIQARLDEGDPTRDDVYFILSSIFYQDLMAEALAATRQALAYPAPLLVEPSHRRAEVSYGDHPGDVQIPGGRFLLGALPGEPFVFDNEKWAHPVDVRSFSIARAPVTQAEFAAFVDAGGYSRKEFWSEEGWGWRTYIDARMPLYWRREGQLWQRRDFDLWVPIEPNRPMLHVGWYEAEAYCRWARRRLPTEIEWELAASGEPGSGGQPYAANRRRYPWGEEAPGLVHANLDGLAGGCLDVAACAAGDSAWGCRQLLGNVWEWTASDFVAFPGFAPDPILDRSRPHFGTHKVLRGGCWLTRSRLLRTTFRFFFRPDRRDLWAGFRTCSLA